MTENNKITGYPSKDKPWLKYYTEKEQHSIIEEKSAYQQLYDRTHDLNSVAIQYFTKDITFKRLFEKIEAISNALNDVQKGDVVSISLPNIPEAIYIFYAVNKKGAVANMIDCRKNGDDLAECINKTGSRVLFIFDQQLDSFLSVVDCTPIEKIYPVSATATLFPIINRLREKRHPDKRVCSFMTMMNKNKNTGCESYYDPTIPAVYEHTSGTTGKSKVVMLGNKTFTAMVNNYENFGVDIRRIHRFLNLIPPFMAYGIVASIHMPLSMGWAVRLIPKFEEEKFFEQLMMYHPNMTNATTMHWKNVMNETLKRKNVNFDFLLAAGMGGDSVDPTFEKELNTLLNNHGCTVCLAKGYGMTEVGSTFTASNGTDVHGYGSVGIPFAKNNIMICDELGNELEYGSVGELYLSGPTMMMGYLNDKEATDNTIVIKDGSKWIRTGDLAKINENGEITIVGRIKRMIISYGGEKVFPSLIERAISEHPAVEDVCVVGIKDPIRVCVPKAYIVIKSECVINHDAIIQEIQAICEEEFSEYKRPAYYKIMNDLPKTPNGKIDYRTLEKLAEEQNNV